MLSRTAYHPDPDRLFAGIVFNEQQAVCVAVSGGGDSLALLVLLKHHLDQISDPPALIAVTVDHGMRPESAEEARMVAGICATHGIQHRTMEWRAEKPRSGLAAAARAARLDLLARAARETGAQLIFTGHTQDDQAETVSMRLARGAGRGTAGIAPATLYKDRGRGHAWFLRPLLSVRRPDLRVFLQQAGIHWIDDPSNENRTFERVRVRQQLDDDAIAALAQSAEQAARERLALGLRASMMIDAHVRRVAPGLYRLDGDLFAADDAAPARYAFRIVAAMAGGSEQLAGTMLTEAAFDAVRRGLCATLSRAVVDVRRAGVHLYREGRNLPMVTPSEAPVLWDGRFWVRARGKDRGVRISGFGQDEARRKAFFAEELPQDILFASQTAEPALWRDEECLAAALGHPDVFCEPAGAPWAGLAPSFDLAPQRAIARLCGATPAPPLPLTGHNQR